MSEFDDKQVVDNKNPDPDNVDHQEVEHPQEKKISAVEEQALAMGWRPKEEWEGDEDAFVDAKEFVGRQKFYDRIESQNHKIKDLEKTQAMLLEHHKKVYETSYKQALNDLKAQKVQALREGEYETVSKLDDQIDEVKKQAVVAQQSLNAAPSNEPSPGFVKWVNANQWYVNDPQLRQEADRIGISFAAVYKEKPAEEIVEYVAKEIKRLHPEKFRNPNKERSSVVEGASSKPRASKDDSLSLTEEEEQIMKKFVRQGIMTADEYKKELKRARGV